MRQGFQRKSFYKEMIFPENFGFIEMISLSFRNRFNDFLGSLCFIERKSFSFQIQFSDIFCFSVNVSKKVFKRQCYETFIENYDV